MADTHRIFVGFDGDFPYGGGNDVIFVEEPDTSLFKASSSKPASTSKLTSDTTA